MSGVPISCGPRSLPRRWTAGDSCAGTCWWPLRVYDANDEDEVQEGAVMRQYRTTVTQRGQVTIPIEVRRLLGLKPYDSVTFTVEGNDVRLSPSAFTVESAFGSVTPRQRPEDLDALTREVKEERVERFMRWTSTSNTVNWTSRMR